MTSIGTVFGPLGGVTGAPVMSEGERHTFDFGNTVPGRVLRLVIRKTSLHDGYASYRFYPIDADGSVWAWGNNSAGQIGDGTYENRPPPVQVQGLADVVQVAAEAFKIYPLTRDGIVWTWGARGYGLTIPSPTPIGGLENVVAIAAGGAPDRRGSV